MKIAYDRRGYEPQIRIIAISLALCSIALALVLASRLENSLHPVLPANQRTLVSNSAGSFEARSIGRPSFMSPHASPIAIQDQHVFVVNTPADTVDLIERSTYEVVHRIPVGIDPVSIAVRPDGNEIWVSNHISDSVSVIDTNQNSPTYLHVIATIQSFDPKTRATSFDEPMGIAFANNKKAYVALSSENQIAVVDVATRSITKRLKIQSQDPRQIVVENNRLYVIPFESNNKTQLSGGSKDDIDGDLVTFDAWNHSIANNNVLSLGHVVDIVKHPRVPDRDLYVFDTSTDRLIETVDTLGTLLYGMTVDSKGDIYIAQTDARNDVNGRAGTKDHSLKELENRAFLNRVTKVELNHDPQISAQQKSGSQEPEITFFDLEPVPPDHPDPGQACATPFAIEIGTENDVLFVTAAGSDALISLEAETGTVLGRVEVGGVPRGISLDTANKPSDRAWIFNAVDNSVSLVDVAEPEAMSVMATIELEDPTDPVIKRGRKVFNTAAASTTGTFSCASCHPDGHTDQLLWVLKTPIVTGGDQIMPRSTMPIRGLRETAPFHWDGIPGDPYGGNNSANLYRHVDPNSDAKNPESTTRHLIDGALASTMARFDEEMQDKADNPELLTENERDDLAKFLLSVPYPPAQRRAYTNELSELAREGFELFHILGDDDPSKHAPNVCGDCHRMPNWVSTNTPGTGMDAPTWRGAYDRWLILPQGRLNMVEFPFFRHVADEGLDERSIWRFSWGGRNRFDPVWNMVLEGSTGFSGTYGRQITLNQDAARDDQVLELLDAIERAATEESVVLEVVGVFTEASEPRSVNLQFDEKVGRYRELPSSVSIHDLNSSQNRTQVNYISEPNVDTIEFGKSLAETYSRTELIEKAATATFVGTFTAHVSGQHDYSRPQPVLWTLGPIERQRGHQEFPFLHPDQMSMTVSGRHVEPDAKLLVNGRRTDGKLTIEDEVLTIELLNLPPEGIHMLQLQNPNGLLSNDFIFHVSRNRDAVVKAKEQLEKHRTDLRTALVDAAAGNDIARVKSLLDRGAKINSRHPQQGGTALSAAALNGNAKLAGFLLNKGANVAQTNRDGNSPLHVAAFLCRFDVVERLLERGGSIRQKNHRQETALDVVSGEWNDGLAAFYKAIADSSGFEIDLKQMETDRKRMVQLLRSHEVKGDRESKRHQD